MELIREGNLRSNLLIKKYNPHEKYLNLFNVAQALSTLHKQNLVHGDFHSGNILLSNLVFNSYISDFGLSRLANKLLTQMKFME